MRSPLLTLSGFSLLNLAFYLIASHLRRQVALLSLSVGSSSIGFMSLLMGLQSLAVGSLLTIISAYLLLRFGVSLILLGCSGRGRLS